MRQFVVPDSGAGMRADRFLGKKNPDLPGSALQKAFRRKDVKRNGRRCFCDTRLASGDTLTLYLPNPPAPAPASRPVYRGPTPDIRYEDENILVLYKPSGLLSQANREGEPNCEDGLRAFLLARAGFAPEPDDFVPSLCHRLDRGTEGLILAAKTPSALRILTEKIRNREIVKTYRAVVHGLPQPAAGYWKDYLRKDPRKSYVTICAASAPGAKTAELSYKVLETRGSLSLIECRLITGRTHQIRVQCAHRGHPILGDGKYGREGGKKAGERRYQALCALSIAMEFTGPAGVLDYLRGKTFTLGKNFEDFC